MRVLHLVTREGTGKVELRDSGEVREQDTCLGSRVVGLTIL